MWSKSWQTSVSADGPGSNTCLLNGIEVPSSWMRKSCVSSDRSLLSRSDDALSGNHKRQIASHTAQPRAGAALPFAEVSTAFLVQNLWQHKPETLSDIHVFVFFGRDDEKYWMYPWKLLTKLNDLAVNIDWSLCRGSNFLAILQSSVQRFLAEQMEKISFPFLFSW